MTTDDFITATHAEADRRMRADGLVTQAAIVRAQGFAEGAEWARARLAAQEPTDAEVEAAAIMLCASAHHDRVWKALAEVDPWKQERIRADARAALSAARAARRDERDKP